MDGNSRGILIALLVAIGLAPGCSERPDAPDEALSVVNFANWFDYIGPNTIGQFIQETGIEVNYEIYDSNEILAAKLLVGDSGYDLVVPSSASFVRLRKAGVLQPLDWSRLKNAGAIDQQLLANLSEADPGNRYAVPYAWGSTGIGFNVAAIRERMPDAPVDSWAIVFDPAVVARFEDCGVAFLDSPGDVTPSALLYLGRDPMSERDEDLRDAMTVLERVRPFVRYFHGSQWIDDLANGEVCLALGWSGGVAQAQRGLARDALRYVIPSEGALSWHDVLAIPADAEHVASAYRLIDHLLRPEVAADFTNTMFYPNAVSGSLAHLDPAVAAEPSIYPPIALRGRLIPDFSESPEFERRRLRMWTQMKAGRSTH